MNLIIYRSRKGFGTPFIKNFLLFLFLLKLKFEGPLSFPPQDVKHNLFLISGALCARLSGDASKVQGATGARIGSILQGIAGKYVDRYYM